MKIWIWETGWHWLSSIALYICYDMVNSHCVKSAGINWIYVYFVSPQDGPEHKSLDQESTSFLIQLTS